MSKQRSGKRKPDLFREGEEPAASVNREPRVTVTMLIDVTSSLFACWAMYLAGLRRMYDECGKHPATRSNAYVSLALCGPEFKPTPYRPFSEAELPEFTPKGGSPGGKWLSSGVKHLRAEHKQMQADGVPSNKDVFLFITDYQFDDPDAFDEAVEAYRTLERERPQFNGFMVMAGKRPNREVAAQVSKKRPPVHLDELKIDELFEWVKVVTQNASMSRPGEAVEVPPSTWRKLSDGPR